MIPQIIKRAYPLDAWSRDLAARMLTFAGAVLVSSLNGLALAGTAGTTRLPETVLVDGASQ